MTSLPLQNGALFIDNSFLEHLQTCPRLLQYTNLLRRIPVQGSEGASFGTAGHLVLEHRYRHYGTDLMSGIDKCEVEQSAILEKYFTDHPPKEDSFRHLNWAQELFIKRYNQKYPIEPFNLLRGADGKPVVELSFSLPFAWFNEQGQVVTTLSDAPGWTPIYYSGKIDLPIMQDGHLFVLDHKSLFYLNDAAMEELSVSPQQIGYCWAFWKATGQRPLGFIVNGIRTRPMPDKPKNGVAAWWEEAFLRHKEYLMPWHYEEWERNTLALMEEFLFHARNDYFPLKRKWCHGKYGKCGMWEVCRSPETQRLEYLQSDNFMHNEWSPLKKV
jgi:hypothetical protein